MGEGWSRIGESVWCRSLEPGAPLPDLARLEAVPGVVEAWMTSAGVACVAAGAFDPAAAEAAVAGPPPEREPKLHVVEVRYEGAPDLDAAARSVGLAPGEFAALHSGAEYVCTAVGFAPGFAYLGPLPPPLDRLPRRPSPRPVVEAGWVGVAAGSTAVYPGGTPGGWWLVGRTEAVLARWEEGYFAVAVGDRVRFVPVRGAGG
jgi:allophanate hydrolase subunit 1